MTYKSFLVEIKCKKSKEKNNAKIAMTAIKTIHYELKQKDKQN